MKKRFFVDLEAQAALPRLSIDNHGVSVHNGVIVVWDRDYDDRVTSLIDSMDPKVRAELVAIHERKALLWLWWKDQTPDGYAVHDSIDLDGGDIWTVNFSGQASLVNPPVYATA